MNPRYPSTLAVSVVANASDLNPSPPSTPDLASPSGSTFFRTAATLEGLARQLEDLRDDADLSGSQVQHRCCCGVVAGCPTLQAREGMENKLKLCGEIGNALLQRYEALEKKYQREVEKYEHQLEVRKTALAESVRRVNNLERANATHLQKFGEMSKKSEALEKRYTQAMHTQTLTQQTLTHVRGELTTLRTKTNRQSIALASGIGVEERLAEVEQRYEDAKESAEAETRKAMDETRKRKRAESRIDELEGQLRLKEREIEEIREGRANDAQELLANAKDRLAILHAELSESFQTESPSDSPQYQRTLEDLVANNALLKHDASELSSLLAESREEVRVLRDEIDELRSVSGIAGRLSPDIPLRRPLAAELSQSISLGGHARTESSPLVGNFPHRLGWSRMNINSSRGESAWEHQRKASTAASVASSMTDGLSSPGLGMGPIGEFGGALVREPGGSRSPPVDGKESPKQVFRTSPSGGLAYVLNGMPKNKTILVRPPARRSVSGSRPISRIFSSGVESIAEWAQGETEQNDIVAEELPPSPATEYFRAADATRNKRRSLLLHRAETVSPRDITNSPSVSITLVEQSVDGTLSSPISDLPVAALIDQKRVNRRTLLLLTKSTGTQTDTVEPVVGRVDRHTGSIDSSAASTFPPDPSETLSLSEPQGLTPVLEHLNKLLSRLRSADIPTLNKRLRKQHLPGDVGHLSRSTLRALQGEVADMRQQFRGILDVSNVTRKEFSLLVKLLKDIFHHLIELQAIVNDVTVEPPLAKKLQKEAYRDEEEAETKKQASGLGWIAAPITKFFITPASDASDLHSSSSPRPGQGLERSRLQTLPATKQQASLSATTTHVSVEFGGTGITRRATPAIAPALPSPLIFQAIPPSPILGLESTHHPGEVDTTATSNLAPPTVRGPTLRPSKSRANRSELLGIFAGAPRVVSPTSGGPWVVVPADTAPGTGKTLRAVSSQQFGEKTIRARGPALSRRRLYAAVDAVIDPSADQLETRDLHTTGTATFDPPLLQRQLRSRGLSDSSIRSTFQSHAHPSEGIVSSARVATGPVPRAMAYGATAEAVKKGYLESLASRFYTFRGPEPSLVAEVSGPTVRARSPESSKIASPPLAASPSRGIPGVQPKIPGESTTTLPTTVTIPSSQTGTGFLGMLASSIPAGAESITNLEGGMGDEEVENGGAGLRQGYVQSRKWMR